MRQKRMPIQCAAKVGAGALAFALVAGALPTGLDEPAAAATPRGNVDSLRNPVTVEQMRAAGNATVDFLYAGAAAEGRLLSLSSWPSLFLTKNGRHLTLLPCSALHSYSPSIGV